jgi:hypothetical protein
MSEEKKTVSIAPESQMRTLFVDSLKVDIRTDGMYLMRFFASLPEGWSEQARLMVSDAHLGGMLKVLTKHCKSWAAGKNEDPSPVDEEHAD